MRFRGGADLRFAVLWDGLSVDCCLCCFLFALFPHGSHFACFCCFLSSPFEKTHCLSMVCAKLKHTKVRPREPRPAQVPCKKIHGIWRSPCLPWHHGQKSVVFLGAQARPDTVEKIDGIVGGPGPPRDYGQKSTVFWGTRARPDTMERNREQDNLMFFRFGPGATREQLGSSQGASRVAPGLLPGCSWVAFGLLPGCFRGAPGLLPDCSRGWRPGCSRPTP